MSTQTTLDWPLMENNITTDDMGAVIDFLKTNPRLTQGDNVKAFEQEWSDWLGVKHSVFINSGSSANLLSMLIIKELYGTGEIIVPTLTWVSDIASVIQNGHTPVFVDIDENTLGMDEEEVLSKITPNTKAVFLTHVQGFNALTPRLLKELEDRNIPLIEDVCESHGATMNGQKVGAFGLISNFSFYFAHHMSTIEGGMLCTNDDKIHQMFLACRSHGMIREFSDEETRQKYVDKHPDLSPDFIFAYPAYNVRNNEIGAVFGRTQLKKLDHNIEKRNENLRIFIDGLDSNKYKTDFYLEGMSNYALNLVLREKDEGLRSRVEQALGDAGVEFRRGSSGGGNQTRQPYLRGIIPDNHYQNFPKVDHIHFFGYYIGNYPDLKKEKINQLCELLNSL